MSGYGLVSKYVDERPLTLLQAKFVDAYLGNRSIKKTALAINKSTHHCYDIIKSERVQFELARRVTSMHGFMRVVNKFRVSKSVRLEMLWTVSQAGAELVHDRLGNLVMANPKSAVRAVKEMNRMIGDDKQEIKPVDSRSENQIINDIEHLIAQFNKLEIEAKLEVEKGYTGA